MTTQPRLLGSKGKLPTLSTKHILSIIKSRRFENAELIKQAEQFLTSQRPAVFILPKTHEPVILLVSGGLDSIIMWEVLLKEYQFKVYPLFLDKGEKRGSQEWSSVNFFSNYFKEKYPKLFVEPFKQTAYIPQPEIINELQTPFSSLDVSNTDFPSGTTVNIFLGSPGIVPFYAMTFARYLELKNNIRIRTLFSSVMAGDGEFCPSQTLTSLRLINLSMCAFTGDYSWQFTSIALEKELGHFLTKTQLLDQGMKYGLPVDKTWSCYQSLPLHCGSCLACQSRRAAFAESNHIDSTRYFNQLSWLEKVLSKL